MPPNMLETPLTKLTEDLTDEKEVLEEPAMVEKTWRNLWCYFGYTELKWFNIFLLGSAHLFFIYSFYHILVVKKYYFILLTFYLPLDFFGAFGITAGAHRYYTHRSFKANLPIRILLMLAFVSSGTNSLYNWVRDHRLHHKFTDKNADPHNASKGFFFSHVGWLLVPKSPIVKREGRKIDMRDILTDPVVQFQEKHFLLLSLLLSHVIPIVVPWYFWNYELWDCFCMGLMKWVVSLNAIWSINSASHLWGAKPFDKNIRPTDNGLLSIISFGEGWHNYHHVFPWDYRAAEFGWWLNPAGFILDMFAAMGWIYDMKTASKELIEKAAKNKGDGSRNFWGPELREDEQGIL